MKECLDRFVVVGRRHLGYLVKEYLDYYNRQRPHTALDSRAPTGPDPPQPVPGERVRTASNRSAIACERRLGGAIKHYYRRAA